MHATCFIIIFGQYSLPYNINIIVKILQNINPIPILAPFFVLWNISANVLEPIYVLFNIPSVFICTVEAQITAFIVCLNLILFKIILQLRQPHSWKAKSLELPSSSCIKLSN